MSHHKRAAAAPARAAPRIDATNLAGITTLMNSQHVRPGVNLEDAEKLVMGKSVAGGKKAEGDPVKMYTAELNQLSEELGLNLMDDDTGAPAERPAAAPYQAPKTAFRPPMGKSAAKVTDLIDDLDLDVRAPRRGSSRASSVSASSAGSGSSGGSGGSGGSDGSDECDCDDDCPETCECDCHFEEECEKCGDDCPETCECDCHFEDECDCDDDCPDDCDCECHEEEESAPGQDDDRVDSIMAKLESELGVRTDGAREGRRNRIKETALPRAERRRGDDRVTDEQERRRHINSVVADLRGETRTTFGVERERLQDIKASKLEQIGQLRMTIEEEGIDCAGVSNPTSDSSMEEIDSVLNILRLKNDRNRYSSLAEEVILGVAEGIETVFDGSRAVPLVGWKPDYTGYHSTVNIKLHRMRFETSQVVGNIIEKYNVGPTARIIMELLPSFFLYPRQQKKQRGTPGLSSDPHVADARMAMSAIRASDERRTLDDVRFL
jgi:hypothetical protein